MIGIGFSRTLTLISHAIAFVPIGGYGVYHLFYEIRMVGALSLISFMALLLSAISVLQNRDNSRQQRLFMLSITVTVVATCYYLGIRGLIFAFPLITVLFYSFSFSTALTLGITFSIACLGASLASVDPVTVARFALGILLTLFLNACFASLVKSQKQSLEKEAGEDYLTGALNRRSFGSWLNQEVRDSLKAGRQLALLYIDLDGFKGINDTYGHAVGDKMLLAVSNKIRNCMETSEELSRTGGSCRLARLAGDEFALALSNMDGGEGVEPLARQLLHTLSTQYFIDHLVLSTNASIGIAFASSSEDNAERLLMHSDLAMYKAKKDGKNRYQLFNAGIEDQARLDQQVRHGLQEALTNKEFSLVCMPIFSCRTMQIEGAEILLRSHARALSGIGPDRYIPVAESCGLIYEIDLLVIEMALEGISDLRKRICIDKLFFCINISARELLVSGFDNKLKELLCKHRINPAQIELEITETSLVGHDSRVIAMLNSLKSLGVMLSLDDFGTGYTAFNQLSRYPVDSLKIDRSFVANIDIDNPQNSIVDVILSLSGLYGLRVIGEGVETEEQLRYLHKKNCDYVQGFLLCPPVPWSDFAERVALQKTG